jgi:serine/threonine protein kinase
MHQQQSQSSNPSSIHASLALGAPLVGPPLPTVDFALKRALRPFASERARARFVTEMSHVHQCSPHPHLVRHHRAWQEGGHAYVQLELCEHGTVYEALRTGVVDRSARTTLSAAHAATASSTSAQAALVNDNSPAYLWLLAHDVGSALAHMHSRRLVHMDVKPSNIYATSAAFCSASTPSVTASAVAALHRPRFKLGDFGLCTEADKFFDEGDKLYLAPEFLRSFQREACAPSADIFSLGISLYELYCGLDERLPRSDREYLALRNNQIAFPCDENGASPGAALGGDDMSLDQSQQPRHSASVAVSPSSLLSPTASVSFSDGFPAPPPAPVHAASSSLLPSSPASMDFASMSMRALICAMMRSNPALRPTAAQLIAHPRCVAAAKLASIHSHTAVEPANAAMESSQPFVALSVSSSNSHHSLVSNQGDAAASASSSANAAVDDANVDYDGEGDSMVTSTPTKIPTTNGQNPAV